MKTAIITAISALTFGSAFASAADSKVAMAAPTMGVSNFDLKKDGSRLLLNMTLDANKLRMSTNREVVYTPMVVNGNDTLRLRPFSVAGKNRYYSHLRGDNNTKEPVAYRSGQIKEPIQYSYEIPYEDWMESAKIEVACTETGCCGKSKGTTNVPIAQIDLTPKNFEPTLVYVTPTAEAVKERSISAKAYVDFPVNKTEIYPDYRRNPVELKKILATIDSVRADKNLTFKSIHIKGFASPEGAYATNERLAKGRTQTLADYVRKLYKFNRDVITTSYTPEDWAGLEEYVKSEAGHRTLTNADAVLALITDPAYRYKDDQREQLLKTRFPQDYQYLLANVYPGLRHSDYAVNFIVRTYTEPQEIIDMMHSAPQNLSLNELYVAAKSVEPGSPIYNEAFDIAAKMYPNDPVANLNAGCAALQRNDLASAAKYLAKAGDSKEAQYARAMLAATEKDYAKAVPMLKALGNMPEAQDALKQIDKIEEAKGMIFKVISDKI